MTGVVTAFQSLLLTAPSSSMEDDTSVRSTRGVLRSWFCPGFSEEC